MPRLNFVGGPRPTRPDRAREILSALPPLVTPVALVRLDHGRIADEMLELLGEFWVSHIQVYGEVTAGSLAVLAQDGFKAMPVVAVRDAGFTDAVDEWLSRMGGRTPAAVVLDAYDPQRQGGTGKPFEWQWLEEADRREARPLAADYPGGRVTP